MGLNSGWAVLPDRKSYRNENTVSVIKLVAKVNVLFGYVNLGEEN